MRKNLMECDQCFRQVEYTFDKSPNFLSVCYTDKEKFDGVLDFCSEKCLVDYFEDIL